MNSATVYHVHKRIIPAALDLLPTSMNTPAAVAMLLAIGLQESKFTARVQNGGPAHGYWQFERDGGTKEIITSPSTAAYVLPVLQTLNYSTSVAECYNALVHNDVLACAFARLLLWPVPGALPRVDEPAKGWKQYMSAWRPGKPHKLTWEDHFAEAWRFVLEE